MGRQAAAANTDAIESFWRSLRFFSMYRLSIALLFMAASLVFGDTVSLGTQDPLLFDRVAAVYVLASIVFLAVLLRRPRRFSLQLSVQVALDIAALTVMMFASGGQKSGIAILVLVVVVQMRMVFVVVVVVVQIHHHQVLTYQIYLVVDLVVFVQMRVLYWLVVQRHHRHHHQMEYLVVQT